MNIKNLISSGQLELYVANALSQDERSLIDELAGNYPEISDEIKEAEDVWHNFAMAYSRNPRPQARKKIIDGVIKEGGRIHFIETEEIRNNDGSSEIKWWLTAAAIVLLIMVSGLNFMFYLKWNEAEDELYKLKNTITIEKNEESLKSLTEHLH